MGLRKGCAIFVAGLVVCLAVLMFIVGDSANTHRAPSVDASAVIACQDYERLSRDMRDGVLTLPEMRARFQQVDRNAQLIREGEPGVRAGARHALAAITARDTAGVRVALTDLGMACASVLTRRRLELER